MAIQSRLFHKDVYAPAAYFASPGVVRVQYTRHATYAAQDDRYGDLTQYLRDYFDLDSGEIVEVEVVDGQVAKRVVRFNVSKELDLVLVITADGRVKTVWANLHDDHHTTLKRWKFVQPPSRLVH